jgi:protein-disulfide isomerase
MANETNKWVDGRLSLLEPSGALRPDERRAWARLRERDRRFRVVRRNWIWASAMATMAMLVLVALPSKSVCCARNPETRPEPAAAQKPAPSAVAVAVKPPVKAPVVQKKNYKESGSPQAPVVCEIYADFECPACAVFYRDTYPRLVSEYVKTGKVRILHRDFPLPQHKFAGLAARYANAAGEVGRYDLVFERLFATQAEWESNGNIDAAIAPVVSDAEMSRIRELVGDPRIDESAAADLRAGMADRLNQTPTVVVVARGVRNKISGAASFDLLKAYLEEILTAK